MENKKKDTSFLDSLADFLRKSIGKEGKEKQPFDLFEEKYQNRPKENDSPFFDNATAKGKGETEAKPSQTEELDEIVSRIVSELFAQTESIRIDETGMHFGYDNLEKPALPAVSADEIRNRPWHFPPQLTGSEVIKDVNSHGDGEMLVEMYKKYLKTKNPAKRKYLYCHFRQGVDILDIDDIIYNILSQNPNSMSKWLPQLYEANREKKFFKIPKTTIIRVPPTLLQLSRVEYGSLNPTTMRILDEYSMKAFGLDVEKEYFVKTGTYSSKFFFRNAYVHGKSEVETLGEYLLAISNQAVQMAGPLSSPSIYGMSTTNEWVVREFIQDVENNPTIYNGMPLHTEYRFFIDCDSDEILGVSPYWEPNVMKNRFSQGMDSDSADMKHDYIVFSAFEETLMKRYNENVGMLTDRVKELLPFLELSGQWSLDVMQNGTDFYLIDMSVATQSALKECVPAGKLKEFKENWIPSLSIEGTANS